MLDLVGADAGTNCVSLRIAQAVLAGLQLRQQVWQADLGLLQKLAGQLVGNRACAAMSGQRFKNYPATKQVAGVARHQKTPKKLAENIHTS